MYMYTKLKEILMGKVSSSGNKVSNWSPNSVKAIIIMRDFMLVAYHVRQPKILYLDVNEVNKDIQRNGSQGALHNLLSNKQLSCLEEIYVDSVFRNYQGIMNLQYYVNGLVSTVSRLRYYGYADNVNPNEVLNYYSRVQINGLQDCCYAVEPARTSVIQYEMTDNKDWYSKYNLRPENYSLDSERGVLHTWFKKVENDTIKKMQSQKEELEKQGLESAILSLFSQDLSYLDTILSFYNLKALFQKRVERDVISKDVYKTMCSCMSKDKLSQLPINTQTLQSVLQSKGVKINGKTEMLLKYYKKQGLLFNSTESTSLEEIVSRVKEQQGFLGFPKMLSNICSKLVEDHMGALDDVYLMMCITLSDDLVKCRGDLRLLVSSKKSDINWCMDFLLGLGGYNVNSFKNANTTVDKE